MNETHLSFWITVAGTVCWVVCFSWMHRISTKQNRLMDQLPDYHATLIHQPGSGRFQQMRCCRFSGLFARLYGLSASQVQHVFMGVAARDIGLV